MWESNPPARGSAGRAGFEDRLRHRSALRSSADYGGNLARLLAVCWIVGRYRRYRLRLNADGFRHNRGTAASPTRHFDVQPGAPPGGGQPRVAYRQSPPVPQ